MKMTFEFDHADLGKLIPKLVPLLLEAYQREGSGNDLPPPSLGFHQSLNSAYPTYPAAVAPPNPNRDSAKAIMEAIFGQGTDFFDWSFALDNRSWKGVAKGTGPAILVALGEVDPAQLLFDAGFVVNSAHVEELTRILEELKQDPAEIIDGRTMWRELVSQWRVNFDIEGEQPDRAQLLSRIVNSHGGSIKAYLERYGTTGATREAIATLDNRDPDSDDVRVEARILAENIHAVITLLVPGLSYLELDRKNAALPGRTYRIG
jgi:hypothetical protein